MSQNTLMQQLNEKISYAKILEYNLRISKSVAQDFEIEVRIIKNQNEILQDTLCQCRKKIAVLIKKDIQSQENIYQEMENNKVLHNKINDLLKINEELSEEINFNNMKTSMRDLDKLRSRNR